MKSTLAVEDIYRHIDFQFNTEAIEGEAKTFCLLDGFDTITGLAEIEKFAKEVGSNLSCHGFEGKQAKNQKIYFLENALGRRYFHAVFNFAFDGLDDRYIYSTHIEAVREALAQTLSTVHYIIRNPSYNTIVNSTSPLTYAELFNNIVRNLAVIQGGTKFKEAVRLRARNSQRNYASAIEFEKKLFENKARHLVLVLTLNYAPEHRHEITLECLQKDRAKLFNNIRSNKLLEGVNDYIWAIEEGAVSGLHMHLLVFYTSESCHDILIAKLIGEYWKKNVTKGRGSYWNSNAHKGAHNLYGFGSCTGEINFNDTKKREALRQYIAYMTKSDQFVRLKTSKKSRLFGMSVPASKARQGRPRKAAL